MPRPPPHPPHEVTLRAAAGEVELQWGVSAVNTLVLLQLVVRHGDRTVSASNVSKLHKSVAQARAAADAFIAGKERLGYRRREAGELDAAAVLEAAACVELSDDGARGVVHMSTWYFDPVYELEALAALCATCPRLTDLTIRDERAGEQDFDPYVAIVLAQHLPLTRFALLHDSYAEPGDHISSAYTYASNVHTVLAGTPTLRELALHVTFMRDVGTLRHYTLDTLSLRAAQFGGALGTALRTADLPSLTSLRIDLLDAENFSDSMQWSWRPMFETAFPALRQLAIVNAYLGDQFVHDLVTSSSVILPTLEHLDLSYTKLTARGAAQLVAEHARLAHLQHLTLDGNPLDADALAALRATYGDRLRFTPAPPPDPDDVDA